MSFLSPLALMMTAAATLLITALHFLSVRRPPVLLLPTARFVAARDVRAVSRNARPSDLLLLLLRLTALWCAGVAMAGPRWATRARTVGHVIVADASLRADSTGVARTTDVALADAAPVRFVWSDTVRGMRSELGAAWPLVWREAAALITTEGSIDSVAVHVVVPAGGSSSVEGWTPWRRAWPGRVSAIERGVGAGSPDSTDAAGRTVSVIGGVDDDVVRAAFDVHTPRGTRARPVSAIDPGARGAAVRTDVSVRVLRSVSPSRAVPPDTADAASSYTVQVNWPTDGVPAGWTAAIDTAGAIVVRGAALVAPWVRTARAPAATGAPGERILARWSDGAPAVVERRDSRGNGCTRDVGIAVPNGSDVLLAPSATVLVTALAAPCGEVTSPIPSRILGDSGAPTALASASALRALLPVQRSVTPRWLPAVLLSAAIALLLLELALRRGTAREVTP